MESGHPDSPVVSSHPCLPASQKSGDALVPPPVWLPWLFTTWLGARLLVGTQRVILASPFVFGLQEMMLCQYSCLSFPWQPVLSVIGFRWDFLAPPFTVA